MSKRLLSIMLAMLMLFSLLPMSAMAIGDEETGDRSVENDSDLQVKSNQIVGSSTYWSYDERTTTLTITGTGAVPGQENMPWNSCANKITKLIIDGGITGTTGVKAFAGLTTLQEIVFPNSFATVGHGAFANCSNLETVTLPATITTLSSVAFSNCNRLESLYVLNRNINIPDGATWSTNRHLPDNLTVYGYQYTDDTREKTTALYNYIQAENAKLELESDDKYTGSLIEFVAYDDPNNATGTIVGTNITWEYTDATKTLTISGSGDVSFVRGEDGSGTPWYQYRDLIKKVVFEEGVTGVSTTKAFAEMPMLSEIVFPESLKTLGTGIFASNQSLESVRLPDTLNSMAGVVFSNCMNLKSLTIENPNLEVPENSMWSSDAVPGCVAPDGLIVYGNKWTDSNKEATTQFYQYVQYNNEHGSNILFVALDEQAQIEGSDLSWSYDDATKTLSITGEGTLSIVRDNVPWGTYKGEVETIVFGEGVTGSTGLQTFSSMNNLKNIVFSSSFTDLSGTGTFSNNTSLEYVRLPETIERLGFVVFSGTNNLKVLRVDNPDLDVNTSQWASDAMKRLPDNLTVYGHSKDGTTDIYKFVKFQNDFEAYTNDITFVAIDDPNTTAGVIGDSNTFWSYDEATKTLTITGEGYVPGMQNHDVPWSKYKDEIETLEIAEGVTGTEGYKAFSDLYALKEINFPSSFISLGHGTFANCLALEKVTLPETIEYLSSVVFSNCRSLQELRVENRNIDVTCVINGELVNGETDLENTWSTMGQKPPEGLKVYGYRYTVKGGEAETEIYTYINGNKIEFVDLDNYAGNIEGNIKWELVGDTLTVSGEGEIPAYSTDSPAPWADYAEQIKHIVVEKGITAIGANAFIGITDLETAEINRTVSEIDNSAFSSTDEFTIKAKRGSAALDYAYAHGNIETDEIVTANILFIGNSYTEDAREYLRYVFDQYNFGADVNFGHLYSGGKTVAYYANCARKEAGETSSYDTTSPRSDGDDNSSTFDPDTLTLTYYTSTDDAVAFTSEGVRTIEYAMKDMDWDIVIIQGHDVEQVYDGTHSQQFKSNLEYLTNYIKSFDSSVEIGYYMTWRRNQEGLDRLEAYWNTMKNIVLASNSNVSFVIPVGTAVENARTTFLGELDYTSTDSNFTKVNLLTGENVSGTMENDNNSGLQRDETHMSAVVGRFLAGYTIGEYLINRINSMNGTDFTSKEEITEIYSFDTDIGKLPAMYVDAIKASADAAIKNSYQVTTLTDYDNPMESIKAAISTAAYSFEGIASNDAMREAIESKLESLNLLSGTDTTVTVSAMADGTFKATVNVQFGYLSDTVEITGSYTEEVETPEYNITVNEPNHGSVTVVKSASTGETVTITVNPDNGYRLADLTVKDSSGTELELEYIGNGKYTFVMPEGAVTVDADFTRITNVKPPVDEPDEPEEPEKDELPFVDVEGGDWFYDAVYYAYTNGLMDGVSTTQFAPNSNLTRGMVVTILYRLEGEPRVTGSSGFTDVASGAWYADPVTWAAANGIVNGVSDTEYAPNTDITREQLAAILFRYAEYKGYDVSGRDSLTGYTDRGSISAYALDAMRWAVDEGLITGMTATTIVPQGTATRAQCATMLMRFIENIA